MRYNGLFDMLLVLYSNVSIFSCLLTGWRRKTWQRHTMGVYVINKENGDPGHYDDIGVFVEGMIILDNIRSLLMRLTVKGTFIVISNWSVPWRHTQHTNSLFLLCVVAVMMDCFSCLLEASILLKSPPPPSTCCPHGPVPLGRLQDWRPQNGDTQDSYI